MAVKIEDHGDGTYGFRLWVRDKDGRRVQQRFRVQAKNRTEVKKEYTRIQNEVNQPGYVKPTQWTVAEYLQEWLAGKKSKLAAKTFEDYETVIKLHIAPALGRMLLKQLGTLDIERLYRLKEEKGLSASRVHLIHVVLNQALTKALNSRITDWNPMAAVERPKTPGHKTRNVYDVGQVNCLLEHARRSSIFMLIFLGVHTGARLGELCALAWADVDLDAGTVYIHRSLSHTKTGGLQFKATKNEDSRLIALPSSAIPELRRHKAEQAQRRLLLGDRWKDHGLVCPNDDGTPRKPDQASHTFHDFIRRTDLPPIRFHDLRHTHATLLGDAGTEMKVVQERLGHKTLAITGDLYTHVFPRAHRAAADTFDRLLGNG